VSCSWSSEWNFSSNASGDASQSMVNRAASPGGFDRPEPAGELVRGVGGHLVGIDPERRLVVEQAIAHNDRFREQAHELSDPVVDELPEVVVGGHVSAAGERAPRHVPTLVVADVRDDLLRSWSGRSSKS
jgi:hypothetical protein